MSTHLSRYFEQLRHARSLKPGELAAKAGCTNIAKSGGKIRTFELTGAISKELLGKLIIALDVKYSEVERLIECDRKVWFEKWMKWCSEPSKPYLLIRLMPSIYALQNVPDHIYGLEEVEQWASDIARAHHRKCCLFWDRRISIWFDSNGTATGYVEAGLGDKNFPGFSVQGKAFYLDYFKPDDSL